jgi:hypothetical protein
MKWDNSGADELYSKLILLATFVGLIAILFYGIAPIVQSNAQMNDPSSYLNTMQLPGESWYAPQPFAVTNASVLSEYNYQIESEVFTSAVPHKHDIQMWVIRDNDHYGDNDFWANKYEDCILLEMVYGIFNTKDKYSAISYETIVANYDSKVNYSKVPFTLNSDYDLFVGTGPGYSFPAGLYYNEFNISVGWMWNMSDAVDASPWGMVGQILTFSIPDVGPIINWIIGIPVYMTMGFLILAVVSRFLPTTAGL